VVEVVVLPARHMLRGSALLVETTDTKEKQSASEFVRIKRCSIFAKSCPQIESKSSAYLIAPTRIQRRYDHRLQARVKSAGSIDIALEHNIPRDHDTRRQQVASTRAGCSECREKLQG
jgi:hypothetical protein